MSSGSLKASIGELARVEPRTRAEIERTYENQRNPARVYLASLTSVHSRETMEDRLEAVARWKGEEIDAFPWTQLTVAEFEAIRAHFAENYAPSTANLTLAAVRGTLRAAWKLNLVPHETYLRLREVKGVRGTRLPPGRALSDEEIARLGVAFRADRTPYGALCRGLMAAFIACGLRREEVCRLPATNLRGRVLHVIGKGNKERKIPLAKEPLADLKAWLEARAALRVRHGFMFVRLQPSKSIPDAPAPIGIDTMNRIVRSWEPIAGCPGEDPQPITPHDLRRTFISRMLDHGNDLAIVQKLAGHSDPTTTAGYDRREDRAIERAVEERGVY